MEDKLREKIVSLQTKLTGDLIVDSEIHQEIYACKKQLLEMSEDYESIEQIDDDYFCEACGA